MKALMQSLAEGMTTFFSYIPQLIGALVILIIGYIIAKVLQAITTRVLGSMGFEGWMEKGGIKLFVDMFSAQYLNGITVDYTSNMMGSGFTFENPNATGGCGCGTSFSA